MSKRQGKKQRKKERREAERQGLTLEQHRNRKAEHGRHRPVRS